MSRMVSDVGPGVSPAREQLPGQAPVVDLRGAVVAYGDRMVLRGVDLTVTSGEFVAILGPNGSGKSTLVRCLLGLVPLKAGSVSLFGVARSTRDIRRVWRRIGYVPQRAGVASGVPATVAEVVATGRLAARGLLRRARAADHAAVAAAVRAVGLADRVATPMSTLSGGQHQRALIARALAAEPDLLILDEPTAGVDLRSQSAFAEALTSFVRAGGTVLLVAHELGPLESLITRTVVVRDGLIEDGTAHRTWTRP
jgi:zinc transport system ATP-binding protein